MELEGTVQNGVVVFEAGQEAAEPRPSTHFDWFKDFIGTAEGLPEDFADNHDHYIHGTPKK